MKTNDTNGLRSNSAGELLLLYLDVLDPRLEFTCLRGSWSTQ